jgi:hypothetical protein
MGDNAFVQAFWADMYGYGVDLVLNGHEHLYERYVPMDAAGQPDATYGVREIIAGTGGAAGQTLGTIEPTSVVQNTDTYGVLKLVLHPSSYDWQFIPQAGKTFTDSGTSAVHGPPPVA